MQIYPAIDIKNGRAVRLVQGLADNVTDYGAPVNAAMNWKDQGATYLHVVDLDGAFDGESQNLPLIEEIVKKTGLPVELGGGIRTMEDVERVLELGVKRVIIGSAAVKNPQFVKEACEKYGDKIAVGIDALHGTVRTEGWIKDSGTDYIAFAKLMESYGVKTIIFTDIDKDGMLSGPNFDQLQALRDAVSCGIVASGGVSTLEDIAKLRDMGIEEAIAGKAVYTGQLDVKQAIAVAAGEA